MADQNSQKITDSQLPKNEGDIDIFGGDEDIFENSDFLQPIQSEIEQGVRSNSTKQDLSSLNVVLDQESGAQTDLDDQNADESLQDLFPDELDNKNNPLDSQTSNIYPNDTEISGGQDSAENGKQVQNITDIANTDIQTPDTFSGDDQTFPSEIQDTTENEPETTPEFSDDLDSLQKLDDLDPLDDNDIVDNIDTIDIDDSDESDFAKKVDDQTSQPIINGSKDISGVVPDTTQAHIPETELIVQDYEKYEPDENVSDLQKKFGELVRKSEKIHELVNKPTDFGFDLLGGNDDNLKSIYNISTQIDDVIIEKNEFNKKDNSTKTNTVNFRLVDNSLNVIVNDILLFDEQKHLQDDVSKKMQVLEKLNKFIFLLDEEYKKIIKYQREKAQKDAVKGVFRNF